MNDYWLSHAGVRKAAQDAIQVQDACNLSAVIHAWDRAMGALWEIAHRDGHGTDWVNRHPISKLFAHKATLLARVPGAHDLYMVRATDELNDFAEDFTFVTAMAEGKTRMSLVSS